MSGKPEELDFRKIFESAPHLILVLKPDLTIVAVTEAYLSATMLVREEILGKNAFDVFPDNPGDPSTNAKKTMEASFEFVLKNRTAHNIPVQRYDIRRPESEGGTFEVRYWSPVNTPVLSDTGDIIYILHRVEDITEFVRLKQHGVDQNELAADLNHRAERMELEIYLRAKEVQERTKEVENSNRQLEEARDLALESSRVKSDFLANMSHEIRTPMNGILGMTHILLKADLSSEVRAYVSIIRDAGQSLLAVVNDILDFSKIESGKLNIDIIEFQPAKLIKSVGELLAQHVRSKNLTLITSIDDRLPTVLRGDPVRIRQILLNLAGNAVKFSQSGEVCIKAFCTSESENEKTVTVKIEVTDQGIGLSQDEIAKLFQPFVQSDASVTRRYGGTGLGLTICNRLVTLMSGEIGVSSVAGEGSKFWFSLPLERCSPSELPVATPEFMNVEQHTFFTRSNIELPALQTSAKATKRPELILLAEDHPINQRVALLLLNEMNFEAHVAENGRQALELLSLAPYDLVLMDVQMPEMSGLEATAEIRKIEISTGSHLPVIAMTAHAIEGSRETCLAAGMDDYISKPIDPARLKSLLQKWLPEMQSLKAINIASLQEQYGELSDQLIEMFLSRTPDEIAQLRMCTADFNQEGLLLAAHTLKGVCGSLTAKSMQHLCAEIEKSAKESDWDSVTNHLQTLEKIFAEIQTNLAETKAEAPTV